VRLIAHARDHDDRGERHVRGAGDAARRAGEFGIARADASTPYSMLMIGFGVGGS
jgi:hypothetical protein